MTINQNPVATIQSPDNGSVADPRFVSLPAGADRETAAPAPEASWYRIPVNGAYALAPLTADQLAHFSERLAGRGSAAIEPAQPPADLARRLGGLIAALAQDQALAQDPPVGAAEPHKHHPGTAAPDGLPSAVPTGAPRDRRTTHFSSLTPGEGATCSPLPAGEEPTTQEEL